MHIRKLWGAAAALAVLVGLAVATNASGHQVAVLPEPGYQAPAFQLRDFQGRTLSLSQYRGQLVFVNFWASWCPPCQAETPDLVKMYQKYHGKITFLGVNLTGSDRVQNARGFIRYYGIRYPVLMDPKDAVTKEYDVFAIPTSLFINRQGIIVSRVTGGMTKAVMQSNFAKLLAQTGPA